MARSQIGVDELRSNLKLGTNRGMVILRISSEEKKGFSDLLDEFARENAFVKIARSDGLVLTNHEFMSVWYTRVDGVTIHATDVTLPEKMRVLFIDGKGDVGMKEAERLYHAFKSLSSKYRSFE